MQASDEDLRGADAARSAVSEPCTTASSSNATGLSAKECLKAALLPALLPTDGAAVRDEAMLDRGMVSGGAGARTRLLLKALAAGKRVSTVVLGGSIAMGHGTRAWPQSANGTFGAIVHRWLDKSFPAATVRYHNGAVGGTPSDYMSLCLNWHCPQDADLVLVEYAVNDIPGRNLHARRPFERLLRKLLVRPNRPEVLLVMTFANDADFERASAEDDMAIFAMYYGLPWVSLRGLLFHATRGQPPKLALETIFEDNHHPRDIGHQMMADMIIGHFRRAAAGLLLLDYQVADDAAAAAEVLPPPLFEGNEAIATEHCIFHDDLKAIVLSANGFHWINEALEGQPSKEGYVATEPGSQLRLQLNTSDVLMRPDTPENGDWHAVMAVSYLCSYQHMGTADVVCAGGCTCEPSVIDGHIEAHNSQHFMHRFGVSRAEECEVIVTVANETKSGEHKVKIMGVVLLDDIVPIGSMPAFHDDVHMGTKGVTGDLRFTPAQDAESSRRAR